MGSLHGRLLIVATLVLVGFLGATGTALHNAFRDSAEAALRERLLGYIYALLAAADEDSEGRMLLPKTLPDRRFSDPESGLYAVVRSADGSYRWRSPSLTGLPGDFLRPQSPGARDLRLVRIGGRQLMVLGFGIAWEDYMGGETRYTLAVAADTAPLLGEVQRFRATLWTWLGGLAAILLLVQGAILRWSLRPLRSLATDLGRIESGQAERLVGRYPRELQGLTSNLNALLASSRATQQRYRNSLDDLAHSMKTPLAILRTAADERVDPGPFRALVQEQVQRMDAIVQHQLRRAAASGRGTLGRAVLVAPLVERLARSLDKVYRDKAVQLELVLAPEARFFGDEADLMEVLGNLLDNAFKFGRQRVRVTSLPLLADPGPRPGLELCIEDDGPGIEPARLGELTQRGLRLDQGIPGQGIGLSVAQEIVGLYEGRIKGGRSPLGGALLRVRWPPL